MRFYYFLTTIDTLRVKQVENISLNLHENLYGDDYIKIYSEVKNDVFFFNSINEPEQNREGGLVNQIIGDKFYSKVNPK